MLATISEPIQHSDWSRPHLDVEYAINNSVHSTTKQTPSVLLFGISQCGRIVDKLTEYLDLTHSDKNPERNLDELRSEANNAI